MNIYSYKSLGQSFKDIDIKQGIVTGYFAAFDNIDADGDVIRKGAFAKTINENFARIKHLLNHDPKKAVAKIQVLKEDATGLFYESLAGKHADGKDFLLMAESGIITEHSIGFKAINQKKQKDFNEIKEVQLWEGSSLTHWGANGKTPIVSVKGKSKEEDLDAYIERAKALEKFCRNSEATDETIQLLLLEQKQLIQIILDLKQHSTASRIEPLNDEAKAIEVIKNFTNNLNKK